jgi:tRNA A-37 threonylcarbamoyl transferase component Bud32
MPHTIGRFELQDVIGEGAMGTVYRAFDPAIGRAVAVKLIRFGTGTSQATRDRVLCEARSGGALAHPNVVTIFDVGVEGNLAFIAMELVDGPSLAARIESSAPFRPSSVVPWLDEIADALDHAHQRGVVHRDIKPSNILFTRDGRVKLADFGIAKVASMITAEKGLVIGTPGYMAPEQMQGLPVDHRADVFALGVVVYELLAGRCPFEGDSLVSTIYKVNFEPPPPLEVFASELPDIFECVVAKALEKAPSARYGSCGELVAAVREAAQATLVPSAPAARIGRFCGKCGAAHGPAALFCYRCGTPRVERSEVQTEPTEVYDARTEPAVTVARTAPTDATAPMSPDPAGVTAGLADPAVWVTEPLVERSDTAPLDGGAGEPRGDGVVTLRAAPWSPPVTTAEAPRYDNAAWPLVPHEAAPQEGARAALAATLRSFEATPRTPRVAMVLALLLVSMVVVALGVWSVVTYRERKAEAERRAVPAPPAFGPSNAPAGPQEPEQPPPGRGGGSDLAEAPADLVIAGETANVVDAELASGPPDGRFARIRPGGSLAVALPGGRVLRDGGGHEPDVRVIGDTATGGPYWIYAREPAKGFVRIDRVSAFGSHDLGHHRVAEADAFKIVNTGTADLLVDAVVPLGDLEARPPGT